VRVQLQWEPTRRETVADLAALLVALALGAGVHAASGSMALAIPGVAASSYVLGRALRPNHQKEDRHDGLARS
jgi:hypothetical protein